MKLAKKEFAKQSIFLFYRIIIIWIDRKLSKFKINVKRPHVIEVELTNYCNMRCTFCHRKVMSRSIGYMSFGVFKKLIDELSQYPITFIRIVGLGESSCHPDFSKMIRYVSKKGLKLEITTNGELFNRFTIEEILSWNIDILGISIDGVDKYSYENIRIGGDYDSLKLNIERFFTLKNQSRNINPIVVIRKVIMPNETKNHLQNFISTWRKTSNMITFNTLSTINYEDKKIYRRNSSCKEFYFNAHIRYDGSVLLCPNKFIFDKNDVIGNIEFDELEQIWKSSQLSEIRRLHKNNLYPDYCKKCFNSFDIHQAYKNSRKYNHTDNRITNLLNIFINIS